MLKVAKKNFVNVFEHFPKISHNFLEYFHKESLNVSKDFFKYFKDFPSSSYDFTKSSKR